MKIGFLVRTGPYTSQNVDTLYEVAKRAIKKGHEVKIFLYEDGVFNMNKDIKSPQERNIADRMRELLELGAEIKGCGTCAKFRGFTRNNLIEGSKLAGMAYFVEILNTVDRFLSLGF